MQGWHRPGERARGSRKPEPGRNSGGQDATTRIMARIRSTALGFLDTEWSGGANSRQEVARDGLERRPEFVVGPLALPSFVIQGLPASGVDRLVQRAGDIALHGQLAELGDDPARLRTHRLLNCGRHVLRPPLQVERAVDDAVMPVQSHNRRRRMDPGHDSTWRRCIDDVNVMDLEGPVHATMPMGGKLADDTLDLFIESGTHEWPAPRRASCRNGGLELLKALADIRQHFRLVEARDSSAYLIHEDPHAPAAAARPSRCRAGAPPPPPERTPPPRARARSL